MLRCLGTPEDQRVDAMMRSYAALGMAGLL